MYGTMQKSYPFVHVEIFFEIEILKKKVIVVIGMLLNMKEKCDRLRLKSKCDLYCWVQKTIFLDARSHISFFLQRTLVIGVLYAKKLNM